MSVGYTAVRMSAMTNPSHAALLREYLEQLSEPGAESRLPKWTDWLKLRLGGAVALGAALALTACDDSTDGQGNQGGGAGMAQVSAGGALNMTSVVAVYAAPMTGGTSANPSTGQGGTGAGPAVNSGGTGNVLNVTSAVAEYMAPMPTGGASSASIATKYGVPMTGGVGNIATRYGVPMNTGGNIGSAVAVYAAPMGTGGVSAAKTTKATGGAPASSAKTTTTMSPGMRYAVPMGGRNSITTTAAAEQSTGGTDMAALYMVVMD